MEQGHKKLEENIYKLIEQGETQEAISLCDKILEEENDQENLYVYPLLGQAYTLLSNYNKSQTYLLKGLELAKQWGERLIEARIYTRLAVWEIILQRNLENARKWQEKALRIGQEENDRETMMSSYNNLAVVDMEEDHYETAFQWLEKLLEYPLAIQDYRECNLISAAKVNIGQIYLKQERFEEATNAFQEALVFAKERKIPRHVAVIYFNLATVHKLTQSYQEAINDMDSFLETQIELGNKLEEAEGYKELSNLYEEIKDYKNALCFYKCYAELREEVVHG